MDGFEWNKVVMCLLIALLAGKFSSKVADILVDPAIHTPNPYSSGKEEPTKDGKGMAAEADDVAEPIEPLLASANIENGKAAAKKCLQCHSFEKGAPSKLGPNMYDVIGKPMGHLEGYAYSPVFQEAHKAGRKWDYASLNTYLHNPKGYMKNTKMAFVGIKKTQERADVIAYLRSLSDAPLPLPPAGAAVATAKPAVAPGKANAKVAPAVAKGK